MIDKTSKPGQRWAQVARSSRRCVVIVTEHWGLGEDEATAATRLIAGALSRSANVEIVHMTRPPEPPRVYEDSVFRVHRVALHGARPLRASLLRAALGTYSSRHIPSPAAALLEHYAGHAPDVEGIIEALHPDAVVLAGTSQPYDLSFLSQSHRSAAPRVVFVPLLASTEELAHDHVQRVLDVSDVVGAAHPGEEVALGALDRIGSRRVVALDIGFSLNRGATKDRLFGVRFFGRYVLLLRNFPPGSARLGRSLTHEVLRDVLGGFVSIAEIDGDTWSVADSESTLNLPVTPSRMNLWRLMAHALFTVDVRPGGPVGREAIESMLLGTPMIAREQSAAMEHVRAANGGLWYRDPGELFDAACALMKRPLRAPLSRQAQEYATTHHGRLDDFVVRMADLVLDAPAELARI